MKLRTEVERWPLVAPFQITGYRWDSHDVLLVSLEREGQTGRGEAAGVYYKGETPGSMQAQVEVIRPAIEAGLSRAELLTILPPGGARNAVDCALWDLEAKICGQSAWDLAGVGKPKPLLTTFTCGADTPQAMAETAAGYQQARAIKLKLIGEPEDEERVRAVRARRPDVWLGVDANQGFTPAGLEKLMPVLVDAKVSLIEQPFPVGQEALLAGLRSPIPLAADESVQVASDVGALVGMFDLINIKLDKSGGLTEALAMAAAARKLGLGVMAGNMTGTSLAMAPAAVVGQLCDVVDLDGPIFLSRDRPDPVSYAGGRILCPPKLWGHPSAGSPDSG